jgi:hypothetical protein
MLGGLDSVEQARYNAVQMAQVYGTVVLWCGRYFS